MKEELTDNPELEATQTIWLRSNKKFATKSNTNG